MKTRADEKNLKHGYIFLASLVLALFGICLSIEIYFKGGFNFNFSKGNTAEAQDQAETGSEDITLEFQNLPDGFTTKDSSVIVVAVTDAENRAWINGEEAEVNPEGVFERRIDIIVGQNEITALAENNDGAKKEIRTVVVREEEPEKKNETVSANDDKNVGPIVKPEPKPIPIPEPDPQPPPITGLKLYCSITNSRPYVGQTVVLDCTVRDQNDRPVSGGTGSVTVSWQSGTTVYNLPSSNGNGGTAVSFAVPEGNKGSILGSVMVSKSGLSVSSNFSIIVQ